jgi:hypothetical protein
MAVEVGFELPFSASGAVRARADLSVLVLLKGEIEV